MELRAHRLVCGSSCITVHEALCDTLVCEAEFVRIDVSGIPKESVVGTWDIGFAILAFVGRLLLGALEAARARSQGWVGWYGAVTLPGRRGWVGGWGRARKGWFGAPPDRGTLRWGHRQKNATLFV